MKTKKRKENFIAYLYGKLKSYLKYKEVCREYPFPKIMSIDDTLDALLQTDVSIARFGDGEFTCIHKTDLGFQNYDAQLSLRLTEVLVSNDPRCLVAIPEPFSNIHPFVRRSQKYWKKVIAYEYPKFYKQIDMERNYANSFISRPYIDYKDRSDVRDYFAKIAKLWEGKSILIVEGENSKLGVGNDLFSKVKNTRRIITLSKNAFSIYDSILQEIIAKRKDDELILLALGPTATVLAYDLARLNIRAIDLGHLDLEYEWFLKQAKRKVRIEGKDVNELNYFDVTTFSSEEVEQKYTNEIISQVLK